MIRVLTVGYIISNITFFSFSIVIYSLFVSLIGIVVFCLTASYNLYQRTVFLDDFWLLFAWTTTIVSSVLVSCTSLGATLWRDILLISSSFYSEYTWAEASNPRAFVVKLGGLRGGSFVFKKNSLMMVPDETLKASHASTKMEFMSWGNIFILPYFSIHTYFNSL